MKYRVKICCISSHNEAKLAVSMGADALGLVGNMPSGPGVIADELIASIVKEVPPPISTFLLTSEQKPAEIVAHARRTGTNTLQLVDELHQKAYDEVRIELPYVRIVQVIHVTGEESIRDAIDLQDDVDAFLLDSGNPKATIKILGGTGNIHNWDISREIVRAVNVPVFLAGGLNSGNIKSALDHVKPFGVDICSGVRTNGALDPAKLSDFIQAIKNA